MLLKNKIAVIYGGAGAIGATVARTFAREGAKVFLAGRTKAKLEKVVNEITETGGKAEMAIVDALNEEELDRHLQSIVKKEGRIDISFNATGISHKGLQGISLLDLSPEAYMQPIAMYLRSNFLTAKMAGKHMLPHRAGVILVATATAGRVPFPHAGGIAPTWAAMEALSRGFAIELGTNGIRCVCIRAEGMPESPLVQEVMELHRQAGDMTDSKDFLDLLADFSMLKKLPTLQEFANMAAFMASDSASCTTAAVINVSGGRISD